MRKESRWSSLEPRADLCGDREVAGTTERTATRIQARFVHPYSGSVGDSLKTCLEFLEIIVSY
jgi:hypothetical protein